MSFLRSRILGDPTPPEHSPAPADTFGDRRARWAEILQQNPERQLWLHRNLEEAPERYRRMVHGRPSALSLAAADTAFQEAGLQSDHFVPAVRFFGLSFDQAHYILCYCGYGKAPTVAAHLIAKRILETLAAPASFSASNR